MQVDSSFKLSGGRYIFVTARYTSSGLVITSPIYINEIDFSNLIISDEKGNILPLKEEYIKTEWEQVRVGVYDYLQNNISANIVCQYNDFKVIVKPICLPQKKCKLAAMTLFNYDENLINPWVTHHNNIGVEKFYLYWNGKLTSEINDRLMSNVPNNLKDRVQFFGFDIPYWQREGMGGSPHLGQTTALADFTWWAKDFSDFILLSDLDEFVYLYENIELKNNDSFLLLNRFCTTHPKIHYKDFTISTTIFAESNEHKSRYKSLHRTSKILLPGVHCENKVTPMHKNIGLEYKQAELCHVVSFIERENDGMSLLGLHESDFKRSIILSKSKKFVF